MRPSKNARKALHFSSKASICHNLRPSSEGFSPVSPPAPLSSVDFPGAKLIPGGIYRHPDGRTVVFAYIPDCLLIIDDEEVAYLRGIEGPCEAMVAVGGKIYLMRGEGRDALVLTTDGRNWHFRPAREFPAPFAIVRHDEGSISAELPPVVLDGAYSSRSLAMLPSDARRLGALMTDAYFSICDRAAARRTFIQPVIARYRLIGHDGRAIYLSAPVLIVPDSGVQLTSAAFTLGGSDFSVTGTTNMQAVSFSVGLQPLMPLGDSWNETVARVELLLSPQLHPLDENLEAVCTFGHFTSAEGSVSVTLPGAGSRGDSMMSDVMRPKVVGLLARLDTALIPVASAAFAPSSSTSVSLPGADRPFHDDFPDCKSSLKALRKILASPLPSQTAEAIALSTLSLPHTFSAAHAAAGADIVAYASLSANRFAGWLAPEFSVADSHLASSEIVESACRVIFADGSSRVRRMPMPKSSLGPLSPLVCYPSADAQAIEFYHGTRFVRLALSSDPSGRFAFCLSPDLKPFDLPEGSQSSAIPSEDARPLSYPWLVAVAEADDPLCLTAAVTSAKSNIMSLVTSAGSSGTLDSGTARFYLFGRGGVDSLTVSSSRSRVSLRHLDSRPLKAAAAVTPVASGVAAVVGDELVKLSGQRLTTLCHIPDVCAIGWDSKRDEIVCCHSLDAPSPSRAASLLSGRECETFYPDATVVSVDAKYCYTRSMPEISSAMSVAGLFVGFTQSGRLLDLLSEDDMVADCIYSCRIALDFADASQMSVEIPLRGNISDGVAEFHADCGAFPSTALLLASFLIDGNLPHLPPLSVFMPHTHALTLTLRFSASPSSAILTLKP